MKNLKIYTFQPFLCLRIASISVQSMLELYFGGYKKSLTNEARKLIPLADQTFKPIAQVPELNSPKIIDMVLPRFISLKHVILI